MGTAREYDFVVVGGGSAGCVLAARLSESGACVLLLEAGGEARGLWISMPVGYARLLSDRERTWGYRTEPEPALGGRVVDVPCGRLLGGTGSINGMLHVRGHRADYDAWAAAGCDGWGYEDVRPWFERCERTLPVVAPPHVDPLSRAFVDAAVESGMPRCPDFNSAAPEGAGLYPLNLSRGRRASSETAYLAPARSRANLHVVTHALVDRVTIENARATGVEYRLRHANGVADGPPMHARAAREVVIAAGAFNSPALLMRSGIGDPAHLRSHGIAVLAALPGVGANLQNHYRASVVMRARGVRTLNEASHDVLAQAAMGARWLLLRDGPFSVGTTAGGFFRTSPSTPRPDLQVVFWNYSVERRDATGLALHRHPGFTLNAVLLRPESRGSVRIASADAAVAPVISYRHLEDARDARTLAAGLALLRRIVASPSLARFAETEVAPGPACADEDSLVAYARERGGSVYHPVGTCRIGSGPGTVVDAQLRVHGVEALRVADASVMPWVPSGNTNAPTLMIAERAAAWMRGNA